jgi:threonine/homoserine/homoserine lactone efflux protein
MTGHAAAASPLLGFLLGYLAVIAAPGPNMLAIGTLAALRGFRGVLPLCCGVATGAGALAVALVLAFAAFGDIPALEGAVRAIGAVLLLLVAARLVAAPPPCPGRASAPGAELREAAMTFAAGFFTAATNPVTAAYFLVQFLGPLAETPALPLAVLLVPLQALLCGAAVACVFARPSARRLVLARFRAVRLVSGTALAVMAAAMLRPLLEW